MKDKVRRVLTAGIFFLFIVILMPSINTDAAVFKLVQRASQRIAPEGKLVKTPEGRRYYCYETGKYLRRQWVNINGDIYHFNKKGYADTGWITVRKKQYYLRSNGKLKKGGFWKINGEKYFFRYGYGMMMTGWCKIKGNYYYFREEGTVGAMVTNQWVGDKYVDSAGKMLKNTWIEGHYVGADGIIVKNAWVGEQYLGEDGLIVTDTWVDEFYLDSNGYITKNAWVGDQYLGADGRVTTPPAVSQEVKRIFVGDSRTVGMYQIVTGDTLIKAVATQPVENQLAKERTDIYIGKVSMGYDWLMGTAAEELSIVLTRYPNSKVVFRLGINDLGNIDNYIMLYRNIMTAFPDATYYMESVTPVKNKLASAYGYSVTNNKVKKFNAKLQAAFPLNYLDSFNYFLENDGATIDGIHYTPATYRMLYYYLDTTLGGGSGVAPPGGTGTETPETETTETETAETETPTTETTETETPATEITETETAETETTESESELLDMIG